MYKYSTYNGGELLSAGNKSLHTNTTYVSEITVRPSIMAAIAHSTNVCRNGAKIILYK